MPVSDSEIPNRAPRVTPADLEAEINARHYFTAADGVGVLHRDDVLNRLTFCVLILHNGFTVVGKSACASPENFDAKIGERLAEEDAKRQLWALLGFRLRDRLTGFSDEQIAKGAHVLSENFNDNAPIGSRRYLGPMRDAAKAMLDPSVPVPTLF